MFILNSLDIFSILMVIFFNKISICDVIVILGSFYTMEVFMKHLVCALFAIILFACDESEQDNTNNEYSGETLDCRRGTPCNNGFSCKLNGTNEYECLPSERDSGPLDAEAQ